MKNKGFTLIELLAVIVILAIIALIATPIILNIIDDARGSSKERSVEMYARAVKNAVAAYKLKFPTDQYIKPYKLYESYNGVRDFIEYDGAEIDCEVYIYSTGNVYVTNCKVEGQPVLDKNEKPFSVGEESMEAHIGEYVNYVATGTSYAGKWRILGEENGQILLLSDGVADLTLQGKDGYTTGITQMNSIASVYATGTKAVSARSVNVDDINKLLGYDPYKGNPNGSIYQSGTAIQYGITVSYSYGDGAVYYSASNGLSGTVPEYPVYEDFDGTIISAEYPNNTKTLISDYYFYNIRTLKNEIDAASPEIGAIPNTNLYKMINGSPEYWLADQTICVNASRASWQMRYAQYEHINAAMLYHSAGDSRAQQSYTKKVRAVVTLDKTAKLTKDNQGVWQIS